MLCCPWDGISVPSCRTHPHPSTQGHPKPSAEGAPSYSFVCCDGKSSTLLPAEVRPLILPQISKPTHLVWVKSNVFTLSLMLIFAYVKMPFVFLSAFENGLPFLSYAVWLDHFCLFVLNTIGLMFLQCHLILVDAADKSTRQWLPCDVTRAVNRTTWATTAIKIAASARKGVQCQQGQRSGGKPLHTKDMEGHQAISKSYKFMLLWLLTVSLVSPK